MKKRKKKQKEKLSHRELIDLMGVHRGTYMRVRGAIRCKMMSRSDGFLM
jgi:hypothetical protein